MAFSNALFWKIEAILSGLINITVELITKGATDNKSPLVQVLSDGLAPNRWAVIF